MDHYIYFVAFSYITITPHDTPSSHPVESTVVDIDYKINSEENLYRLQNYLADWKCPADDAADKWLRERHPDRHWRCVVTITSITLLETRHEKDTIDPNVARFNIV